MEYEGNNSRFESVYSTKVRAGKRRTYFFDVRKTKGDDYYITLTESTRKFDGQGYDRHKLFLYKEDFNRFMNSLSETVDYVKKELMPDYDYEQYERRQAEWEEQQAQEAALAASEEKTEEKTEETTEETTEGTTEETTEGTTEESTVKDDSPAEIETTEESPSTDAPSEVDTEEDMSW